MEIDLEQIAELLKPCFPGQVGVQITRAEDGIAECSMTIEKHHYHPGGMVHGGVPYTLADTTMAWAIMPGLKEGQGPVTIEQKMSYFDPSYEGELTCVAEIVRRGRRVVHLEATVHNAEKLVAKSTASFYITGAV